jgi:hypothetical protein
MAAPKPKYIPAPTNADRLRNVLSLRKPYQQVLGVQTETLTPEIIRAMVLGTDEARGVLKQIWNALPEKQQNTLRTRIVDAMPSAQRPTGIGPDGKAAYSVDAQKIFDVLDGGDLDPETKAVVNSEGKSNVPKKAGSRSATDEGEQTYVPDESDTEATSINRDGAFSRPAALDVKAAPQIGRLPGPEGFDPKAKNVRDPNTSKGTQVETRSPLRIDHSVEMVNDIPVRSAIEETGAIGGQDIGAVSKGKRYESLMDQRAARQLEMLVAMEGSQENVVALFRRAQEGDAEATARISSVKSIVNSELPKPLRPNPVGDGKKGVELVTSETNPQQILDSLATDMAFGNPTSPLYNPKRGERDAAMEAWKALQVRSRGTKLDQMPNAVFSSPREMAEQFVRNVSPQIFETDPMTPNQALDAMDTMRQFDASTPETARTYLGQFNKDLPLRAADKESLRSQAIERIEKVFADRFGSDWGASYKPSASRWVETVDDVRRLPVDKEDIDELGPAPLSQEPGEVVTTTMDPASLPSMGSPNSLGTKAPRARGEDWSTREPVNNPRGEYKGEADSPLNSMDYDALPDAAKTDPDNETAHQRAYANYKDGKKQRPSSTSANDWLAPHNHRNPMVSEGDLARREAMIGEYSKSQPNIAGAGRTSEIMRQIDELQGLIYNQPEEIVKLQDELQAEGLTPARAKEIRDTLKPMYEAHDASVAGYEQQLKKLNAELGKARNADRVTEIRSAKKGPLSKKVQAAKEGTGNPADTTPVTKPTEIKPENDAPVIESRPDPAAQEAPPPAPAPAPVDPVPAPEPAPAPTTIVDEMPSAEELTSPVVPEAAPDAPIDPLESASSVDMGDDEFADAMLGAKAWDEATAADPAADVADVVDDPDNPLTAPTGSVPANKNGVTVESLEAEAEALAASKKVDEAEAPRDVEASRPDEEAATIPEDAGKPVDAEASPLVDKKKPPVEAGPSRFPWKRAAAGAGIAGLAGLAGLTRMGHQASQNASGQDGLGGGMPGGIPGAGGETGFDTGGIGVTGGPDSDPFGYGMGNAERIRLIQQMRGRVPTGIPQTAQQWR